MPCVTNIPLELLDIIMSNLNIDEICIMRAVSTVLNNHIQTQNALRILSERFKCPITKSFQGLYKDCQLNCQSVKSLNIYTLGECINLAVKNEAVHVVNVLLQNTNPVVIHSLYACARNHDKNIFCYPFSIPKEHLVWKSVYEKLGNDYSYAQDSFGKGIFGANYGLFLSLAAHMDNLDLFKHIIDIKYGGDAQFTETYSLCNKFSANNSHLTFTAILHNNIRFLDYLEQVNRISELKKHRNSFEEKPRHLSVLTWIKDRL